MRMNTKGHDNCVISADLYKTRRKQRICDHKSILHHQTFCVPSQCPKCPLQHSINMPVPLCHQTFCVTSLCHKCPPQHSIINNPISFRHQTFGETSLCYKCPPQTTLYQRVSPIFFRFEPVAWPLGEIIRVPLSPLFQRSGRDDLPCTCVPSPCRDRPPRHCCPRCPWRRTGTTAHRTHAAWPAGHTGQAGR